ncbi:MAG: hypothetical protein KGY65_00925 [Candidatus Thermoplasmatota archaeon]|nr:hypothetical protein [Candidatus Thermoplasmatota archaeon]MBS3801292.1 hypothetical protein [Candidatus Thermoplasmatota archaeon]
MRKYEQGIDHHLKSIGLKPRYEKKYVQYLKRRYGIKRAKLFSKPISS